MVLVGVPGLGLSNNIPNMRGFRVNMTHEERMGRSQKQPVGHHAA
jgi:hypothetical protein